MIEYLPLVTVSIYIIYVLSVEIIHEIKKA